MRAVAGPAGGSELGGGWQVGDFAISTSPGMVGVSICMVAAGRAAPRVRAFLLSMGSVSGTTATALWSRGVALVIRVVVAPPRQGAWPALMPPVLAGPRSSDCWASSSG